MDADNIRKKLKTKNIFIILLFLILIVISYFSVNLYLDNQKLKKKNLKLQNEVPALTETEALNKGKELYDKVTEIYSVYKLKIPYCGYNLSEISNQKLTMFEDELKNIEENSDNLEQQVNTTNNDTSYYRSIFKNLDSLKKYLKDYMSEDLIEKNIKLNEKSVKDLILLQNEKYTGSNYVEYDMSLFCKATTIEVDNSRYIEKYTKDIDPYEIRTLSRDKNKITFLIKSKYLSDTVKDFNKECKDDINKCIVTYDKSFSIEKINNKWIVTVFNMHE